MSSFFHLARDDKERVSSIDEQRNDVAVVGIALFFSPFLLASSDPFVLNFFVRTEPSYISYTSSLHICRRHRLDAMGFGLCRSKMLNGIVARHSPPMRNDAPKKNGTLLPFTGCVGSRLSKFKDVGTTTSSLCWTTARAHWLVWLVVWDPVENASFMPRVLATACIHSVILPLRILGPSFEYCHSSILCLRNLFNTDSFSRALLPSNDQHIYYSFLPYEATASFHRTYQKEMVVARARGGR
ncbi:hypothetical protein MKW92_034800 [Papaver armeniacum]|nr:hypothetical protein MKW92_034800 [Papaver armeniacum]